MLRMQRLAGRDVLHLDVRSDNICFRGDGAVLVDWNHTCRGNRLADIAFWLPSLHSEGGPAPEEVFELEPAWPPLIAGYFASYAGLPPIAAAPTVRGVQLSQLRAALPWAQRALGLPSLDGPNAPGS
jgi:aminoglycoside phosphotransferase (APT) family kinase protein